MKVELNKYVEKPWGYEKWIVITDNYALKEIFFKKGQRCSFQYHHRKEEHIYILSGKLEVLEDNENRELETHVYGPGDIIHNPPTYRHRNTALEDTTIIEVSTPHLDDVVRIEDDYNR